MKISGWMAAKAVIVVVFGIGFALVPAFMGSIYAMELSPAGALMARLFGAAFIFEGLVLWLARNEADKTLRAIAVAVVVSNTVGFVVALLATLGGVMNTLGWLPVGLYLVFGLAFAYFLFSKPARG